MIVMGLFFLIQQFAPRMTDYLINTEILVILVIVEVGLSFVALILFGSRLEKRKMERKQQLKAVTWFHDEDESSSKIQGAIRPLSTTVLSYISPEPCFASSLELRDISSKDLYLRFYRSVEFILQRENGEQMMVCGELLIVGFSPAGQATQGETSKLLQQVFPSLTSHVPAKATEYLLREGDRVEVYGGEPRLEAVPEFGRGYRDNTLWVIRGERGRPLRVRMMPAG